ncbi:MAG TPA: hypothetical protein EYO58_06055 [Flavobacteriales bacterium]|nr:hypothetical protein [Flavobacteriales bacterium]
MDKNVIENYYSHHSGLTDHSQTPRFLAIDFLKKKFLPRVGIDRLLDSDGMRSNACYELKKEGLALLRSDSKEVEPFTLSLTEKLLGFPPDSPPRSWSDEWSETADAVRRYNRYMDFIVDESLRILDALIADKRKSFKRSTSFKSREFEPIGVLRTVVVNSPLYTELLAIANDFGIPTSHLSNIRIDGESGDYRAVFGGSYFCYQDTLCDMRYKLAGDYRINLQAVHDSLLHEAKRGGSYAERWRGQSTSKVFDSHVLNSILEMFVEPDIDLYHVHTLKPRCSTLEYAVLLENAEGDTEHDRYLRERSQGTILDIPITWEVAVALQNAKTEKVATHLDWRYATEALLEKQKDVEEYQEKVIRCGKLSSVAEEKVATLLSEIEKESVK